METLLELPGDVLMVKLLQPFTSQSSTGAAFVELPVAIVSKSKIYLLNVSFFDELIFLLVFFM